MAEMLEMVLDIAGRKDALFLYAVAGAGLVILLVALIFGPLTTQMATAHSSDHVIHLQLVSQFAETGQVPVPHFLYHILVLILGRT